MTQSIFDFVKPASGCGGGTGKEAERRGRWFPCGGCVYVVVNPTRCVGAGARLGGRREGVGGDAPSGNCNKRQEMGAGRLEPRPQKRHRAAVQSVRMPVQLGGALTGRFTAGRQAGWATMPEARVESHSGKPANCTRMTSTHSPGPPGGAPQSAAGATRLKLAPWAQRAPVRWRLGGGGEGV